ESDILASTILKRWENLKAKRTTHDCMWEDIRKILDPTAKPIYEASDNDHTSNRYDVNRLLDVTAMVACQTCARGQMTYCTPVGEDWFAYDPPHEFIDDENAKNWCCSATKIAHEYINASNFRSEASKTYKNRSAYGISALYEEWNCEDQGLVFKEYEIGSYWCEENYRGKPDTIFILFKLTPRQASQMFDELPERLCKEASDARKQDVDQDFLHVVFPRKDRDAEREDNKNLPFASYYISIKDKKILRESGFDDFPFYVNRWDRWGNSVYGFGPGLMTLPTSKQLNFLEAMADYSCEKATFPPTLVPAGYKYDVSSYPGGVTIYDAGMESNKPTEWQTGNGYQFNKDRIESKKAVVEDIFFVSIFRSITEQTKQMTALEVSERVNEGLALYHPIFSISTDELYTPMLKRTLALLMENGAIEPPPESLYVKNEKGSIVGIKEPRVMYNSKIALALRAQSLKRFDLVMQVLSTAAQFKPEILDVINFEKRIPDLCRSIGEDPAYINKEDEIKDMRVARQQAAAVAQAPSQMKDMGAAVKNVGGVDQVEALMGQMP
ncbi:MAG: portal protein, partial [Akkermansia sp.]